MVLNLIEKDNVAIAKLEADECKENELLAIAPLSIRNWARPVIRKQELEVILGSLPRSSKVQGSLKEILQSCYERVILSTQVQRADCRNGCEQLSLFL